MKHFYNKTSKVKTNKIVVSLAIALPTFLAAFSTKPVMASGSWGQSDYTVSASPGNTYTSGSYIAPPSLGDVPDSVVPLEASAYSSFSGSAKEGTESADGTFTIKCAAIWSGSTGSSNGFYFEPSLSVQGSATPVSTVTTSSATAVAGSQNLGGSNNTYPSAISPIIQVSVAATVTNVPYTGSLNVSTSAGQAPDTGGDPVTGTEATPSSSKSNATASAGVSIENASNVPTTK